MPSSKQREVEKEGGTQILNGVVRLRAVTEKGTLKQNSQR